MGGFLSKAFPGKIKYEGPGDLSKKVAIVTGSNQGIGYEIAKILLRGGARVYITSRSAAKGEKALARLKEETGKDNVYCLSLDLSSLASVTSAVSTFLAKESRLHLLYNNAGRVYGKDEVTEEGYEQAFGSQVLGAHVFTISVMDALQNAAAEGEMARVVTTGSVVHSWDQKGRLDFTTLETSEGRSPFQLYCRAKLGCGLWTHVMAKRNSSKNVAFFTVHPGTIASEGFNSQLALRIIGFFIAYPAYYGGASVAWAGTTDTLNIEDSGAYFEPWMRRSGESKAAQDEKQAEELWMWLEAKRAKFLVDHPASS